MKKILTLLLLLCLIFSVTACRTEDAKPTETSAEREPTQTTTQSEDPGTTVTEVVTPLLWKVSGNGFTGEFYLLGSIHACPDGANVYPQEMLDAYGKCDALAVESDIIALENDTQGLIEGLRPYVYADGTTIADHISKDLYDNAVALMTELGIYSSVMDYYKPSFWASMISSEIQSKTVFENDNGVDRFFLTKAKDEKKTIIELEDYRDVYAAEAGLSDKTQEFVLLDTVESFDEADDPAKEYEENLTELYTAWKTGNTEELLELLFDDETEYSGDELDALEEYNDFILVSRNEGMVNKALEFLKQGKNVFYVVGTAHMLGDIGLVQKLTDAGYTVELVRFD